MNINVYFIVSFAFIIVAVLGFAFLEKNYENPEKRFLNFSKRFFEFETIVDPRVIMMTVLENNKEIARAILPFELLKENVHYRVGRLDAPPKKSLIKQVTYRLANQDLFFPVKTTSNTLSHEQFYISKLKLENSYVLALHSDKEMLRLDDNLRVEEGNYYALVPSGNKKAEFCTINGCYHFLFEIIDIYDDADSIEMDMFRKNYLEKKPKERRDSHKNKLIHKILGSDPTQPDTFCYGYKENVPTDKTKVFCINENDTKLYVPRSNQRYQEYPKVL